MRPIVPDYREWLRSELDSRPRGTKKALAERLGVAPDAITRMLNIDPDKESRGITAKELAIMVGFFGTRPPGMTKESMISTFDPDAPDEVLDEAMTQGEVTGVRGVPEGSSPQIDVTAGMGAGGVTIVAEGVPGRRGMTFAAEHVSDYWRLPAAMLIGMGGVKPTDIAFVPVQGDSMIPTLIEGDVVVIDTRHRWPSPDGLYALNDAFGGLVIKRLEVASGPSDDEQLVDVISDNADRHPRKRWRIEELRIVGRVVRKFGIVQ